MATAIAVPELLTGIPNALGGKAWFYQPNTLNAIAIFSDSSAMTGISNPVSLAIPPQTSVNTASPNLGYAVVYITQVARMVVQDVNGLTLSDAIVGRSTDALTTNTSAAFTGNTEKDIADAALVAFGGKDWSYNPGATTAFAGMSPKTWMTGVWRNVLAYAAPTAPTVNDGATPADSAIAAAIADVVAAGGGTVYFPPGVGYLINSGATMTNATGVTFKGAGMAASQIKLNNATGTAFTLTGCSNIVFEDLNFTHTSSTTGAGIALSGCTSVSLNRVGVDGVTLSRLYNTSVTCSGAFQNIRVQNCNLAGGISFNGTAGGGSGGQNIWITNSIIFGSSANFGIKFDGTSQVATVIGNVIQGSQGIVFAATLTGLIFRIIGNNNAGAIAMTVSTASDPGIVQIANGLDESSQGAAVGNTLTPDLSKGNTAILIASSGGAGTMTVAAPVPASSGNYRRFTLVFINGSGGAVTWSLNAIYKTTAAIPTTNGHTISVDFVFESSSSTYREIGRGDTVT